jgi:hypothetical protein
MLAGVVPCLCIIAGCPCTGGRFHFGRPVHAAAGVLRAAATFAAIHASISSEFQALARSPILIGLGNSPLLIRQYTDDSGTPVILTTSGNLISRILASTGDQHGVPVSSGGC